MKKIINTCVIGALLAPFAIAEEAQQEPAIPVGSLSTNHGTLRAGAIPEVSWSIQFPAPVEEVIEVDEDDEITTKTRLRVQAYMLGVAIGDGAGNEWPTRSYINFSSTGWDHIFSGTGSQVNPLTAYVDRIVDAGETIRFASKLNRSGFNYYYNHSDNVVVLRDGDLPPGNTGFNGQANVVDFLEPYIKNGKISLGPRDVIYASELYSTNPSSSYFDLQDTVVLVRFSEVED